MKNLYTIVLALFISAIVFGQTQEMTAGDGSFDNPYDVTTSIQNQGATDVWVTGYIVGIIDDTGTDNVDVFAAPFATATNLYIALTAGETNTANMLIIQLKSAVRSETNLVDNPGNIGKEVKFKGDLMAYFEAPGLKETNGYWLDGSGLNPDYPATIVIKGTSAIVNAVNETFDGNVTPEEDVELAGWLNANKQGERYWIGKDFEGNSYTQTSGYGATYTNLESWLVTPGVVANNSSKLEFGTKVGYWKHNALNVLVSSDFEGDHADLFNATWHNVTDQCNIPTEPTTGYGTVYSNTMIDLSSYAGQTIYVLFKYTGDNAVNTTTVQIDDVVLTGGTVGINDIKSNSSLSVYPNPSTGLVTVDGVAGAQVMIYNIVGELVYNQFANSSNITLNLSSFEAGNYIVKVVANNKVSTKKLTLTK